MIFISQMEVVIISSRRLTQLIIVISIISCVLTQVNSRALANSGEEDTKVITESTILPVSVEEGVHNYNSTQEFVEQLEGLLTEDSCCSVQIMAVGDIMMHQRQILAGVTSDGYDFQSFFSYIKPLFDKADLVFGNLETTFAGPEFGYAGYPSFNSPDELAEDLKNAGFDCLTTANNHSLDRGEKGLLRTLTILDELNIYHSGTYDSKEAQKEILVIEKNQIKIAVLAYTYGTNGLKVPDGKEYLVNYIDHEKIKRDVEQADTLGVDLIAVAIHFGDEYQKKPNQDQIVMVNYLFSLGVDLIFGSHPHVLQPYELREWITDTGESRQGVVIYSLGNFISDQRTFPRSIGGVLTVDIEKSAGETTIADVSFVPTYVHRYFEGDRPIYHVLPIKDLLLTSQSIPAIKEVNLQLLQEQYRLLIETKPTITTSTVMPVSQLYIVQPGDTLYKLAKTYNTTLEILKTLNPGLDPNLIKVGQVIAIP